jgi:hypothetical protein
MRLHNLLDAGNRSRYRAILLKELKARFWPSIDAVPILVFGLQRSGTTMLIQVLQLNPHVYVFNETDKSKVFLHHMLRNDEVVRQTLQESRFPFVAYKPISDSHRADDLLKRYSKGWGIWMFRSFRDVANSTDRKWQNAERAIRIVCTGGSGGGWFQEGVTPESLSLLRSVYHESLSRQDCLCLVWWARNRLVVEGRLSTLPNLVLVDYNRLVKNKSLEFRHLFSRLGIPFREADIDAVHPGSINKHDMPPLDPTVESLCQELTSQLEAAFLENRRRHGMPAVQAAERLPA